MNQVSLIGYIEKKPLLSITKKGMPYSDFRLILEDLSSSNDKAIENSVIINCRAINDNANWIFRNCLRGTLVEITGHIGCMKIKDRSNVVVNFVSVDEIKALIKRELVLEDFETYIEKYNQASIKEATKKALKKAKEKEEENAREDTITND